MNVDRAVQRAETKIESIPTYLGQRIRPYSKLCATLIEAIHIDSPFTTTFVTLCFLVQLITATVPGCGSINSNYFGVPPFSHFIFTDVVSWFRLFSHVLGHGSWSHLNGNVVNLLLVGPGKYSSAVVDISIPLSKTPKQVFFNPINILTLLNTLYYCF